MLETATTLGALSGVLLSGLIPVPALYFIFAVILLLSAQQMLARRSDSGNRRRCRRHAPRQLVECLVAPGFELSRTARSDATSTYRVHRVPLGMSLMYGAGLISALLGIGSGVLKIPAMDTALAPADQGLVGDLQLHDRRDGGRQRRRVLPEG